MIYTTVLKIISCDSFNTVYRPLTNVVDNLYKDCRITIGFDCNTPIPFDFIFDRCGLDDALLLTRSIPEHDREWRLFAVWCARQVMHFNPDARVKNAIEAAEGYANGKVELGQLKEAKRACMVASNESNTLPGLSAANCALATTHGDAYLAAYMAPWLAYRCYEHQSDKDALKNKLESHFITIINEVNK